MYRLAPKEEHLPDHVVQTTPTGIRLTWKDYPVIDFTAWEALDLAHRILQRREVLLEMYRSELKQEQEKGSRQPDASTDLCSG